MAVLPKAANAGKSTNGADVAKVNGFDAQLLLTSVGSGRSSVNHKVKAVVFQQGDPADAVFYIEKGRIQLTVVSEHGKEAVVAILGPGDFLGEGCLAGQPLHMASAPRQKSQRQFEFAVPVLHCCRGGRHHCAVL